MRFSRIYDADGGYREEQADSFTPKQEQQASAETGAPSLPAPQPAPSEDPKPGPNTNPAPQGGVTPPPSAPPPAIASSIPGIAGSEATGGVQGSFAQAGTGGFNKRFGLPAAWFKGGPSAGLARESANRGRVGAGGQGFNPGIAAGAETVASVSGPSTGSVGGGQNDEEFQRLLKQVLQNRFQ